MNDLVFLTASELAKGIREKDFSATEVLTAHLERIAKYNGKLNVIATLNETGARKQALAADEAIARGEIWGKLHGVPITIKDTLETAGLRSTASYPPLAHYIPQQDATAVARLKAEGAIVIGKTNCPKLASDYQGHSPLFGRANNPWNLAYTPGGSTSGGASAVAAGFTPLELGSDIGGSIRQPAHCCGILGLKPTDRLVPTSGHLPELPGYPKSLRHMLVLGPLARSIADLELCLSIVAGADIRQPEIPSVTLLKPLEKSLKSLKIAWSAELGELAIDREMAEILTGFVDRLDAAGCAVEEKIPAGFNCDEAWETYGGVVTPEIITAQPTLSWSGILFALKVSYYKTQVNRKYRNSPLEKGILEAIPLNFTNYMQALTKRDRYIAEIDVFLNDWDAYICPVSTIPAFPHQPKGKAIAVNGIKLPYLTAAGGYTILFNLTGHPVVTLPVGKTKAGLPVGVQVVGKRWRDLELLATCQQLMTVFGAIDLPNLENL